MKILIVGSKGFIGSRMLQVLEKEYEVWGCDVFTDYNERNFLLVQVSNLDFNSIFIKHQFDICINCSGAASVPESLKNPARDFELNVHNVFLLLEAIRSCSPQCKFINFSSAAVYGDPQKIPTNELQDLAPISPYGFHKMYAEKLCQEYFKFFQVQTCSLRVFSAYGPGLKKQIFWDLFSRIKRTSKIELFGTGMEARDFIFIDDIVKATDFVIQKGSFNASIYNLAGGKAWSIKQVSEIFLEAVKWKGRLTFTGAQRPGDPAFWEADISKIIELGFTPTISLSEGIKRYAEWLSLLE